MMQWQKERVDKALEDLNLVMRCKSQYCIGTSLRGFMSLNRIDGSGNEKNVLWLGNDPDKAISAIACVTEWEENK